MYISLHYSQLLLNLFFNQLFSKGLRIDHRIGHWSLTDLSMFLMIDAPLLTCGMILPIQRSDDRFLNLFADTDSYSWTNIIDSLILFFVFVLILTNFLQCYHRIGHWSLTDLSMFLMIDAPLLTCGMILPIQGIPLQVVFRKSLACAGS
jgi:hypothetical protein